MKLSVLARAKSVAAIVLAVSLGLWLVVPAIPGDANENPDKAKKIEALVRLAESYRELADLSKNDGRADDARKHYEKILALEKKPFGKEPELADCLFWARADLVNLLVDQKKFDDAAEFAREGTTIFASKPEKASECFKGLGRALKGAGKVKEAEAAFQKSVELDEKIASDGAPPAGAAPAGASPEKK